MLKLLTTARQWDSAICDTVRRKVRLGLVSSEVGRLDFESEHYKLSLMVPLFAHRLELAPGTDDAAPVITECAAPVLERLARLSLQRVAV